MRTEHHVSEPGLQLPNCVPISLSTEMVLKHGCKQQHRAALRLTLDHVCYCEAAQIEQRLDVQVVGRLKAQVSDEKQCGAALQQMTCKDCSREALADSGHITE